jgi:hypothetical protein
MIATSTSFIFLGSFNFFNSLNGSL